MKFNISVSLFFIMNIFYIFLKKLNIVINQIIKLYSFYDVFIGYINVLYIFIYYKYKKDVDIEKDIKIIGCVFNKILLIVLVINFGWSYKIQII